MPLQGDRWIQRGSYNGTITQLSDEELRIAMSELYSEAMLEARVHGMYPVDDVVTTWYEAPGDEFMMEVHFIYMSFKVEYVPLSNRHPEYLKGRFNALPT